MFQVKHILIAFLCVASAKAATYTAASCAQADVQAAITSELATPADGDIISIPSGTCTWTGSSQLTVTFTTSVIMMGAGAKSATTGGSSTTGSDLTTIIDNLTHGPSSTIAITTSAGKSFRWTGIFLQENASSQVAGNGVLNIAGPSTTVRIDHSHFFAQLSGAVMVYLGGSVQGVADHDFFDALSSLGITNDIAFHNGITWNGDTSGFADKSWTDSDHFGTGQFFFAEDCQFNNGDPTDAHDGARYVVRNSTINGGGGNGQFFNHGLTNARGRATRAAEVYNNTMFQSAANGAVAYSINSGALLFWGNTVTQWRYAVGLDYTRLTNGTYNYFTTPTNWGNCGASSPSGGSNWDQNSVSSGYACMDAAARGAGDLLTGNFPSVLNSVTSTISWPRQVIDPIYVWNNTYTPATGFSPVGIISSIGLYTDNKDYYQQFGTNGEPGSNCTTSPCNITVGVNQTSRAPVNGTDTCVAGPGGNTPGVGWWNTANSTLYVCNPTNTWSIYYTAFTYPHPLTVSSTSIAAGTGQSDVCNGGFPAYCARTDVAASGPYGGVGISAPFSGTSGFAPGTGAGTVAIDPFTGELEMRLTDAAFSTAASSINSYTDADASWTNSVNSDGTMFMLKDLGGALYTVYVNPTTLQYARVDAAFGTASAWNNKCGASPVSPTWSWVTSNLVYCGAGHHIEKFTTTTGGTVGAPVDAGLLADADAAGAMNGWMAQSAKWTTAVTAPTVVACPVSGANQVCGSTTGGSLADGGYAVCIAQADTVDSPASEQNLGDSTAGNITQYCGIVAISGGGGNGSIQVFPPTQCTALACGLAGDTWYTYTTNSAATCTPAATSTCKTWYLTPRQTTSTNFAASVTITTLVASPGQSNRSCGKTHNGGPGCIIDSLVNSSTDSRFMVLTGGIAQNITPLDMIYDVNLGWRWFDGSNCTINNGAGSGWASQGFPTGTPTLLGDDPSCYLRSNHSDILSVDPTGSVAVLAPGKGVCPTGCFANTPYWYWPINGTTITAVDATGSSGPANVPTGHETIATTYWAGQAAVLDCQDDYRTRSLLTPYTANGPQLVNPLPAPAGTQFCGLADNHSSVAVTPIGGPFFEGTYNNDTKFSNVNLTNTSGIVSNSNSLSGNNFFIGFTNNPSLPSSPVASSIHVFNCVDTTFNGDFYVQVSKPGNSGVGVLTWNAAQGTGASTTGCSIETGGGANGGVISIPKAFVSEVFAVNPNPGNPVYRIVQTWQNPFNENASAGGLQLFYQNTRGHTDQHGRVAIYTTSMANGLGTMSGGDPRADVFWVLLK